jgi:hypothetical protein
MGTVSDVNNISCFIQLVLTFSRYETPVDGYRTVYKETLDTAEKIILEKHENHCAHGTGTQKKHAQKNQCEQCVPVAWMGSG